MKKKSSLFEDIQVAPLTGGFMLIGLLAFFLAVFFIRTISLDWAFIIGFIGAIMFFASMVSMTKAPVPEELLIDEHIQDRRSRVRVMSKKEYEEYLKQKQAKSNSRKKKISLAKSVSSKKPITTKAVSKKKTESRKKTVAKKKAITKKTVTKKKTASTKKAGNKK
jgi:hypothetical protein